MELVKKSNLVGDHELRSEIGSAMSALPFELKYLQDAMSRSLSLFCYMDTKTENSYHSFFLGVFGVALHDGMNVFVKSNAESGNGRFNIFIEFRDIKRVIIFELKQSKQPQALEKDAKDALFQILDRNYAYGFDDTHRLLIGASFHKRTMSSLYLTQFQRGLSCCKPAQTGTTMPSCQ